MPREPRLRRGRRLKGAPNRDKMWDNLATLTAQLAKSRVLFNNSTIYFDFTAIFHELFQIDPWTRGDFLPPRSDFLTKPPLSKIWYHVTKWVFGPCTSELDMTAFQQHANQWTEIFSSTIFREGFKVSAVVWDEMRGFSELECQAKCVRWAPCFQSWWLSF